MLTINRETQSSDDLPETDEPVDPPDEVDGDDGDDGEPVRWVTVATFWNPAEAHIARIKLESEEIDCVIVDENLVATQWLWANAIGGIKVQVPEDQVERALGFLESRPAAPLVNTSGEPVFDGLVRCPQCGSDDIYLQRFSRRFSFLSILLLGLPLPFIQRRQRCTACGFEWKQV